MKKVCWVRWAGRWHRLKHYLWPVALCGREIPENDGYQERYTPPRVADRCAQCVQVLAAERRDG